MSHNLKQCSLLVGKAAALGAKALFLPEASDYIASSSDETVALVKSVIESEFVTGLQREAARQRLCINVGVHEPTVDRKRVRNTLLWIDEDGQIAQRYQKVHLFEVDIPGGPSLHESKSVEPGSNILPPFQTALGKVGLTICFDLRFPEISLALRRQGANIITYPSAFTVPTGEKHWSTLLRARAIETQTYVIAAAQVGAHNEKRTSYGHSLVASPDGEILCELGGEFNGPELASVDIDLGAIKRVRDGMQLLRRTDVYPEV